ncbi:cytochrome-c peroxidase [Methylocapsa acidiphila]|uniref:cytochrome-c peroxidase n=1 Tax=Methylocapsa acidiphila TaxID=133552 RepID=UPI0018DEB2A6|nr:cytochrome c peroxidase [Methylocapsa acidiphila]
MLTSRGMLIVAFAVVAALIGVLAVSINIPDGSRPPTPQAAQPVALRQAAEKPNLPAGISTQLYAIAVPRGREPTPDLIALGEKLFKDKRLSIDDSVACETCHDPAKGFSDHRGDSATSAGVKGQHGQRNAPTVLNAMFQASQFWDGRAATLEDQAKLPILNPVEMGQKDPADVVAKVRKIPEYVLAFNAINGGDVTYDGIAAAIAAFERTQYSGNSPFDHFLAGDQQALSDAAKRGWALFQGKGRCSACHAFNSVSSLFSDQKFHNIGIAAHKQNFAELAGKAAAILRSGDEKQLDELALQTSYSELGRFLVTKNEADIGAFKSETLRNIGVTAPYMHDGSLATLWDVMDHYNKGGVPNPYLDGGMQRLGLSEAEIDDVVAFLFSLTDDRYAEFNKAEIARQTGLKTTRPQRETDIAEGRKGDLGDIGTNPDLRNPATIGAF